MFFIKNSCEPCFANCFKNIGYASAFEKCKSRNIMIAKKSVKTSLIWRTKNLVLYYSKAVLFFSFLLLNVAMMQAQQSINYALHANIIYRFTKYVEWPDDNNAGDFVIGLVGDTPLFNELENFIKNKTVGSKKIVLKKMLTGADGYKCQILFISEDKSKSIKKIAQITKGTPTLIVSESDGLALKGSCINFIVVNDHLKLEINKSNIEERNLSIASELLSLGTVVK